MEKSRSPDVVALQSLCDKEGGYKVVARAIDVNDQSLYQIISGVLLPSGRPKGIGPGLRDKLTARYPGWDGPRKDYAESFPNSPNGGSIRCEFNYQGSTGIGVCEDNANKLYDLLIN